MACGDVNSLYKLTGGTKAPPYGITERCMLNPNFAIPLFTYIYIL